MTVAKIKHSGVWQDLVTWSSDLPLWQRDALRRIVEKSVLNDADIIELTLLCKAGLGLTLDNPVTSRPLASEHVPSGPSPEVAVSLRSISEPENVNALDKTQELTFGVKGVTVIFGYNGSGKSGYGRILRRACRARSTGTAILPNVLQVSTGGPASAVLTFALGDRDQPLEQWVDGQRSVPALGAVSFFDAQCALVHVREKNDVAFMPSGLDVLPKLGAACKEVQKKIDLERKSLESIRPKFLQSAQATGTTGVAQFLKKLSPATSIEELELLASLNDTERDRLKQLPVLLANDPKKRAVELQNRIQKIKSLVDSLGKSATALSDAAISQLRTLVADAARKRTVAETAARVSFADDPLSGIGEDVWRELWQSARLYSAVAYPEQSFPVVDRDGAACVLCQQPLQNETAKDRLRRFEKFVSDDTAQQAGEAAKAVEKALTNLNALTLDGEALKQQLDEIATVDAELDVQVRGSVTALAGRRLAIRNANDSGNWEFQLDGALVDVASPLNALNVRLTGDLTEIQRSANEEERKRLEGELANLRAREWLASVLGDVKDHLTRLADIRDLDRCIEDTKTNKVTTKSKALAKEYVTDQLRDAFATEIRKLEQGVRRLNVELAAASGEYGSSFYRIQLVGAHKADIGNVVSEGEHQCIALAGFLAELATEQGRSAIVFDDPVTSLDHLWRGCFAQRLVSEAATRQVIIFTHDIVFLHDLIEGAERNGVPLELRRVQPSRDQCGLVSDGLPWIAQKTLQRIDELEKKVREAKIAYDAHDDDGYERCISNVYGDLRATVERAVEEHVFRGVILRHRDYISLGNLTKVTVTTVADCERFQKLFQRCCDITAAHDRASLRSFGVPTPIDALNDLAELRAVVVDLKARQNAMP
jgi:hypothetical protein